MNRDYEYAEPIGSVEVDQAQRRLDSQQRKSCGRVLVSLALLALLVLAVLGVGAVIVAVFSLEAVAADGGASGWTLTDLVMTVSLVVGLSTALALAIYAIWRARR